MTASDLAQTDTSFVAGWVILLLILIGGATGFWAVMDAGRERHMPGNLSDETPQGSVYDWLARGDFDHEFMAGPLNDRCHQIIDEAVCGAPREEHVS